MNNNIYHKHDTKIERQLQSDFIYIKRQTQNETIIKCNWFKFQLIYRMKDWPEFGNVKHINSSYNDSQSPTSTFTRCCLSCEQSSPVTSRFSFWLLRPRSYLVHIHQNLLSFGTLIKTQSRHFGVNIWWGLT